jgi:hypothetical protein
VLAFRALLSFGPSASVASCATIRFVTNGVEQANNNAVNKAALVRESMRRFKQCLLQLEGGKKLHKANA